MVSCGRSTVWYDYVIVWLLNGKMVKPINGTVW